MSVTSGFASLGILILQPAAGENFFAGKTITIICGYPPGGGVDAGARLIAQHLPSPARSRAASIAAIPAFRASPTSMAIRPSGST